MFDDFENYLSDYGNFLYEELDLIRSASLSKRLGKKDYLLREGQICRHKTFVCKGCLRSYRINKDATEYILNFAIERSWISDDVSFHSGEPSSTIIDALEDSEVIQWSNEDFSMLLATVPAFNLFYRWNKLLFFSVIGYFKISHLIFYKIYGYDKNCDC